MAMPHDCQRSLFHAFLHTPSLLPTSFFPKVCWRLTHFFLPPAVPGIIPTVTGDTGMAGYTGMAGDTGMYPLYPVQFTSVFGYNSGQR